MSVRYSGNAVIRLGYDPERRIYRGTVADPYLHPWSGAVPLGRRERDPTSSRAYDDAARRLIHAAERWAQREKKHFDIERTHGRVILRRVFHSACPLEDL